MHLRLAVALMVAMVGAAQGPAVPEPNPVPVPPDRAADSYEIYSLLLEQGLKYSNWTPKYWLVEETTTAVEPSSVPCLPDESSARSPQGTPQGMIWTNPPSAADRDTATAGDHGEQSTLRQPPPGWNPHYAKPPAGHEVEFRAVLDDFDSHCRERVILSADRFHTAIPVHLADKAMEERFMAIRNSATKSGPQPAEFDGVAGIETFSEVFFNPQHTLALVHQGNWCGTLCGTRGWVILERKEGHWTQRGRYGWSIS